MGIPDLCQVELELSELSGPGCSYLRRRNWQQLLPARILPVRFRSIPDMEQSFFLLVHWREHQYDECQFAELRLPHPLFMADSLRREIRSMNGWRYPLLLWTTVINEKAKNGGSAGNHRKLTPNVSISLKPFHNEELRFRFFYKVSFRLPSFNDLYYDKAGNINLKPESATQYNIGITYSKAINDFIPYLSATVDAYHNKVTDKIVATPTKNLFIWSMVNLGKVDIKGVDATASLSLQPLDKLRINLSGNYTYQRALDVTNSNPNSPEGKVYKHQIAYTPRVSASGQAGIETPWLNLSYSFLFSGKRYMLGQNISDNRLDSYSDHSISAYRDFKIQKVTASLNLEVLNLMNRNYEIVKNFPMPGRSVRVTIGVRY